MKEKSLQTEDKNFKEVEGQTDSIDTTVTVKWGEQNHLPLPAGTVVLKYEVGSNVSSLPLDYPVMSSPAPLVFHPVWGL